LRRFPGRFGRFLSKRIHLERENLRLLSTVNSRDWEIRQLTDENTHLVAEIEEMHRRVEQSRKRAEHIDSLLGSSGIHGDATPILVATTTSDEPSPPPTTT
jgi:predicted RNase H-like nuclease (RuvC/YqgF family)